MHACKIVKAFKLLFARLIYKLFIDPSYASQYAAQYAYRVPGSGGSYFVPFLLPFYLNKGPIQFRSNQSDFVNRVESKKGTGYKFKRFEDDFYSRQEIEEPSLKPGVINGRGRSALKFYKENPSRDP